MYFDAPLEKLAKDFILENSPKYMDFFLLDV